MICLNTITKYILNILNIIGTTFIWTVFCMFVFSYFSTDNCMTMDTKMIRDGYVFEYDLGFTDFSWELCYIPAWANMYAFHFLTMPLVVFSFCIFGSSFTDAITSSFAAILIHFLLVLK